MSTYDLLNAIAMLEMEDGVIGFPTDTIYGMGCHVHKTAAIEKLYRMKGKRIPLVMLGRSWQDFMPFVDCQSPAMMATIHQLIGQYWPGALTLVLPLSPTSPYVPPGTAGTLGLRVPQCDVLLDLLTLIPAGVLLSTSANPWEDAPALRGKDVLATYSHEIDYLLEYDLMLQDQTPSTVVAVERDGGVQLLRSGPIVIH
jgi:L-threonylcarbamoyladenylate synthase